MPEGDTLHRIAARLAPALEGQVLRRFDAPRLIGPAKPRPGVRIDGVEARGKHLLVRFDDGLVLQTHLQMSGSWHLYRPGERWRRPAHLARAVIEVDGWVAVCFAAPTVRTFIEQAVGPAALAQLGPDLCSAGADTDEAVRRAHALVDPQTPIAAVLLDQRVAAGIGNIYKSESLFACRVDPFATLDALDDATLRRLFETAAKLLRANATDRTGPRATVPGGVAVYRRARRPCIVCGTPIRMTYRGSPRRSTYWCPRCQSPPAAGA